MRRFVLVVGASYALVAMLVISATKNVLTGQTTSPYCDSLRAIVDAKYVRYLHARNAAENRLFSDEWDSARRDLAGAIAGGNCNSIGVNERGETQPTPLGGPPPERAPTAQYCDDLRAAADAKYVEYLEAPGYLQPGLSAEWDSLRRDLYSAIEVGHCNNLGVNEPGPPAAQGPLPQYGKCEFEKQSLDNALGSLETARAGNPGSIDGNRNVMMQELNVSRAQDTYDKCMAGGAGSVECARQQTALDIALMDYQSRSRNASKQQLYEMEDNITLLSTGLHACNGRLSECDDEYVDVIRVQKAAANRQTESQQEALAQADLIWTAMQRYDDCVAIHGTGLPGSSPTNRQGCDTEECQQWRSHQFCMSGLSIAFRNELDDYELPDPANLNEHQKLAFASCLDDFMREAQERAEAGRPPLQRPQESAVTRYSNGCQDEEKELQIAYDLHYYGIWPEGETEVTTNPWQRYTIAADEEAKCRTFQASLPPSSNPCAALDEAVTTMEQRFGARASGNLAFEAAKERAAECNSLYGVGVGQSGAELCSGMGKFEKLFSGSQQTQFLNDLETCHSAAARGVSVTGPASPAESTYEFCDAMQGDLRQQMQNLGINTTPFTIFEAPPGYAEANELIQACYFAAASGGRTQNDPQIAEHCKVLSRTELLGPTQQDRCNKDFYDRFCSPGYTPPTRTPAECDHFPEGRPVGAPKEVSVEPPASLQESTFEKCDAMQLSLFKQLDDMGINRNENFGLGLPRVPGYAKANELIQTCYVAAASGGRTLDDPEIVEHCKVLVRSEIRVNECNDDFFNRFCSQSPTHGTSSYGYYLWYPAPANCDHFPEGRSVGAPPEVSVVPPASLQESTFEKCDAMQASLSQQLHDMGINTSAFQPGGSPLQNVPGYARANELIQTCYVAAASGGRTLNDPEIVAHCKELRNAEIRVNVCNDDFFNRFCAHSYEYGFNWGGYFDHNPAPASCDHFPEGRPVGAQPEITVDGPPPLRESTFEKCDAMWASIERQLKEMGIDKNERLGVDLPRVPGYSQALQKTQTCYVAAASGGRTLNDPDIVKRCKELKEAYLPSNACLEDFFYRFCAYSPTDGFGWHGYFLWYPEPDECDHFPENGGLIGGPANGKPLDPANPPRNRLQPGGMNNAQNGQPAPEQGPQNRRVQNQNPNNNAPNAPEGAGNNAGQRPAAPGGNNPQGNGVQQPARNNNAQAPRQQGGNALPPPAAPPAPALVPLQVPAGAQAPARVDMNVAPPPPPPPPIIQPVELMPLINTWNTNTRGDAQ